jgi:hypothetical protein
MEQPPAKAVPAHGEVSVAERRANTARSTLPPVESLHAVTLAHLLTPRFQVASWLAMEVAGALAITWLVYIAVSFRRRGKAPDAEDAAEAVDEENVGTAARRSARPAEAASGSEEH